MEAGRGDETVILRLDEYREQGLILQDGPPSLALVHNRDNSKDVERHNSQVSKTSEELVGGRGSWRPGSGRPSQVQYGVCTA